MRLEHPAPEPYPVDDYDFTFANGLLVSFSVVKELGDTVDFDVSPMAVKFHFAEKPSPVNIEAKMPQEDITVLMQHVITVAHRTRLVTPPTHQEKSLFQSTLHSLSKTVQ